MDWYATRKKGRKRMQFVRYLKERWKTIAFLLFAMVTIEIFLLLYPVHPVIRIYIALIIPAGYLTGTYMEYHAKKSFYDDVMGTLDQFEDKYMIVEMLPQTQFTEEELLKQILQDSNKAMLEKVNSYKHILTEYKDYIELWIHEIKLPIATARMMIENNPGEVTKNIEDEIDEIEGYTEQALYYARSSHANKDYCVTECNVKDMVNEVIKRNKKTLINQRVKIVIDDIERTVYTDSKWCHFILNQIINNSIKYKKEMNAEIHFFVEENKENVILYIKDNGIGIKRGEIGKVFEKGFTGSNGRRGKKSTGIGLYLCKKLCNRLGLGIELESEENAGTEVKIMFPKSSFSLLK